MDRSIALTCAALALLALGGIAPTTLGDHGTTVERAYVASGPGLPLGCAGCADAGVAVVRFEPNGQPPVHVEAEDAVMWSVPLFVCQDTDGNGWCGEEGEPRITSCFAQAALDGAGLDPGLDMYVFVVALLREMGPNGELVICSTAPVAGTVTVHYA